MKINIHKHKHLKQATMVKNYGGNKAKKQGRKFANAAQTLTVTRLSTDNDELYACCSKIYGNGKIGVHCHDGIERICVIRNKFRGRGKRGNTVQIGSWLLVGRRSFEKVNDTKKETTDLLTVYSGRDVNNLKQKEMQYAEAFKDFEKFGSVEFDNETNKENYEIKFEEENKDYYENMDLPSEDEDEYNSGEIPNNIEEEIAVDDI